MNQDDPQAETPRDDDMAWWSNLEELRRLWVWIGILVIAAASYLLVPEQQKLVVGCVSEFGSVTTGDSVACVRGINGMVAVPDPKATWLWRVGITGILATTLMVAVQFFITPQTMRRFAYHAGDSESR